MKTTITIDGVSAEVELTPEQAELFNVKPFGRQRVKQEAAYWHLTCCGEIENNGEYNDNYDKRRFERGNYFLSKEDAEAHDNYTLAVVKVNDRIDQLNQGWKMVWDLNVMAHMIVYSNYSKEFKTDYYQCYSIPSVIKHSSTEQIAEQIIEELTPELEVIFNYQI